MFVFTYKRKQLFKYLFKITDNRRIRLNVLIYLGSIYIDVDYLCILGKFRRITDNTVRESDTKSNKTVTFGNT